MRKSFRKMLVLNVLLGYFTLSVGLSYLGKTSKTWKTYEVFFHVQIYSPQMLFFHIQILKLLIAILKLIFPKFTFQEKVTFGYKLMVMVSIHYAVKSTYYHTRVHIQLWDHRVAERQSLPYGPISANR